MSRKWWPWIALIVLVVVAGIALVVRSQPDNSPAARASRLQHELACPVCEGQSVADSNAFEASAIRAEIPELISQGKTDAQIRAYYASRYGDRILLTPANGGIGLVAWLVPAIVLFGGLGVIVVALRRWSRTPRLTATADDEAIVAAAREDEHDDD